MTFSSDDHDALNHDETGGRPAHGEAFAHPQSELLWRALQQADESAKVELLELLRGHLASADDARSPHQQRVARATAALREAAALQAERERLAPADVRLGERAYAALREEHAERGWPPAASVRRWLGGTWNEALRGARLNSVVDGEAVIYRLGPAFTREEACAAVRRCTEDLGRTPTWWEYLHWARRPDVRRSFGRRPRSQPVFDRLFPDGGWLAVLQASQVIDPDCEVPGAVSSSGVVRPSGFRYNDEQLRDALSCCAQTLGGSPSTTAYMRWRAQQLSGQLEDQQRAASDQRPLTAIPTMLTFWRRWRTWDEALKACGLDALGGRGRPGVSKPRQASKKGRKPAEEQLLRRCFLQAYEQKGDPFTINAFAEWREQQQRDAETKKLPRPQIPHWSTYQIRFGGWKGAHLRFLGRARQWH